MKNCNGCKYVEWERTKNGRLHPSGDGKCKKQIKMPKLPAAMHWLGGYEPIPDGGIGNRHHDFKDHCPCYTKEDSK